MTHMLTDNYFMSIISETRSMKQLDPSIRTSETFFPKALRIRTSLIRHSGTYLPAYRR